MRLERMVTTEAGADAMTGLTRRNISAEDKARFVMLCMTSNRSVAVLCRENRIGQSSYYLWRALFIRGGTDHLRRVVRRVLRPKKQSRRPPVQDIDRVRFFQRVAAFQDPIVQRRKRLSLKSDLVDLIETAGFSKTEALALAGSRAPLTTTGANN